MNVLNITVFVLLCVYSTAADSLRSNDLANLFVKHSRNELLYSEAKIIDNVLKLLGHVWDSVTSSITNGLDCFVCQAAFEALIYAVKSEAPDEDIVNSATTLCSVLKPKLVCRGFVELNLPTLKYIIKTTPEATPKTFCGILLQSDQKSHTLCAYDDPRFEWQIELPPKVNIRQDYPSANLTPLTVAVLSDIHIDMFYEPFGVANCDDPICCREGQKPKIKRILDIDKNVIQQSIVENDEEIVLDTDAVSKIVEKDNRERRRVMSDYKSEPAGYWGNYKNCDTPVWTFKDVIRRISEHKEVDVVYYLGDSIDHHIWETTYELFHDVNNLLVGELKEALRCDVVVLPAIGNHDSHPVNQFAPSSIKEEGLNSTWIYESFADKWGHYFSDEASRSMRQRGRFSMLIRPGLRVISINNNVAYKHNWWVVYDPLYPKKHLEWLVEELHKAELLGEKVHILSHIPPGDADLLYTWTREYHRVVERFSSTIVAQFNGHVHTDEFKIFYKNGKAFSVAWGAGSISTLQNLNPNYKIVTFDKDNFEATSITNYIFNLTKANQNPGKSPCWYKLYEMKDSFQLQDLSATSMDQLVKSMATDKKYLLEQYVKYTYRMSDSMPDCGVDFELDILCKSVTSVLWDREKCAELIYLYEKSYS